MNEEYFVESEERRLSFLGQQYPSKVFNYEN